MQDEVFVKSVIYFVLLLFTISLSAILLKRIRFSYTIGLVLIGIGLDYLGGAWPVLAPLREIRLTPEIIMYLLLPTLVFSAAFAIDSRMLVKNLLPVMVLAAPGLVISTVVTGFLVSWFTPLGLGAAMLFGALISATDPVAVVALFGEVGAPRRLNILVDGESLFNDATAIVAFRIILGMVVSGTTWGLAAVLQGSLSFAAVFGGGLLVGGAVGYVMVKITAAAKDDPLIQIALSTVAAYLAFILADHYLQVSGVMAAMGAGIVLSWFGLTRYTPEVKQYMSQFWEYAAFVANSFIFLLLGLTEADLLTDFRRVSGLAVYIAVAIAAVTLARAVVVYGLCPLMGRMRRADTIGMPYQTVIFWGGLRGAVPLALAFSLTADFADRELIVGLTLGVVLFTLLAQGTTIGWLMHLLRLDQVPLHERVTKLETLVEAKRHGLATIARLKVETRFNPGVLAASEAAGRRRLDAATRELAAVLQAPDCDEAQIRATLWMQALFLSRQIYTSLFEQQIISESVFRELIAINSLATDTVGDGGIPQAAIVILPLERRAPGWVAKRLAAVFPDGKLTKRLRMANFDTCYQVAVAMVVVAEHTEKFLAEMVARHNFPPAVNAECHSFAQERKAAAARRLAEMTQDYPDLFLELQARSIRRIAGAAETEAIKNLVRQGGIPESVGHRLIAEITAEINDRPEASGDSA